MRGALLALRSGAVVAVLAVALSLLVDGAPRAVEATTITSPPAAREQPSAKPDAKEARRPAQVPRGVVTIAAVGDIVMGSTPNLPAAGGRAFFDGVETDLAADVVLGNLEGTLTNATGPAKCPRASQTCFAFRTPPSYARRLRDAGFTVLNLANNHAHDYGEAGLRDTVAALDRAGLEHTGQPGETARQKVGAVRVAVVGFSTYPWAESMTDLTSVRKVVAKADESADVVVVTAHMGAEGTDRQHVRPGTERYLGENRGDPVRFARAAIDAGADLVVGHGPHVLRGMEWYKGRLIAYSLGNFAGYGVFSLGGPLSSSGILRITLAGDGRFETGVLVPTQLVGKGLPVLDPAERAHGIMRTLSGADFGARRVRISPTGMLGRG
jgi:poly-gamma-glutamate capsule biosynthesis protein CapA/YwtB (metallophosphatase superfamily)